MIHSGTTVKVGDLLAKGPTIGTTVALSDICSRLAPTTYTAGIPFGQVVATPIWTQIVTPGAAGVSAVTTVNQTERHHDHDAVDVQSGGANQETQTPTAVTAAIPATSTLTIVGTAGSASTVQITFNIAGYQGSAGLTGPTGTLTTHLHGQHSDSERYQPSEHDEHHSRSLAGHRVLLRCAAVHSRHRGRIVHAERRERRFTYQRTVDLCVSSASGTILFSAANPGAWANTLLTYTVTVLNGTTQTYNTNVAGSATAVAFASGVNGTVTVTLQNAHSIGENVIGIANTAGAIIIPDPGTAGMVSMGLVYCDMLQM